jgi:hypothetical protein
MNLKDIEKRLRQGITDPKDVSYIYDKLDDLNDLKNLVKSNIELERINKANERKKALKGNEVLQQVTSTLIREFIESDSFKEFALRCEVVEIERVELIELINISQVDYNKYRDCGSHTKAVEFLKSRINLKRVGELQTKYNLRNGRI